MKLTNRPKFDLYAQDISPTDEARFWSQVEIDWMPGACWTWKGTDITGSGYGRFKINNSRITPTRVSIALCTGIMPRDKHACHKCDNPKCVRPDHLFAGTPKENTHDMIKKGRKPSGSAVLSSKLREVDVLEILRLSKEGYSQRALMRMFGVSRRAIMFIQTGRNWRSIKEMFDANAEATA